MLSSYSSFWFVTRLETWWMEIAAYLNRLLLPSLFFNPKTHKPFVITSWKAGELLFKKVLTVKKAERRRIDAFELWFWRRLLRVPWTARRSNQSIPKDISPGISLEGMMLKLKLQYFGHLMRRVDSLERLWCWEGLGLGEGDDRGWDGWMASPTRWTWVCVNSGRWWWIGRAGVLRFMGSQRVGHDWATELNRPSVCKVRQLEMQV